MSSRTPLTEAEKEHLCQAKLQGRPLVELAAELGCSLDCAAKWWARYRKDGVAGIRARPWGPPVKGWLVTFDARIAPVALALKRSHPGWGPERVLVELRTHPQFQGLALPSASRLAPFFRALCPDCVATPKPRPVEPPRPPVAPGVHVIWGLDSQEGIRLGDGQIATVCNVRDPVGAAMIASQAFATQTEKHWRKLTWSEVREVVRTGAAEWRTLPEILLTDNELGLAGGPNDPFPGHLTLWLVGLGIQHRFIRPGYPTDQPQTERNHRTLDGLAMNPIDLATLEALQQALDRERSLYNTLFPSRASDCAGRPPLVAHPELLCPHRPYSREAELALFDLQRVYDHLATFTFERKVNAAGQVSLGRQFYSVGRSQSGNLVQVQMDAAHHEWIFWPKSADPNIAAQELARRTPKNLDVLTLTGLKPGEAELAEPLQLSFACFVAEPIGTTS